VFDQPLEHLIREVLERPHRHLNIGPHADKLQTLDARCTVDLSDLETAFGTLSQQRVGAILVSANAFYISRRERLAALAVRHALPAIFPYREHALAGGLMSYGVNLDYFWHQIGILTGRILKGEKPADTPVEQAVKIALTINVKTAKALGLKIPEMLLATADEVIE
jgi:putative ABC transport system substrate-binding protein